MVNVNIYVGERAEGNYVDENFVNELHGVAEECEGDYAPIYSAS